jgi:hypothetical protein
MKIQFRHVFIFRVRNTRIITFNINDFIVEVKKKINKIYLVYHLINYLICVSLPQIKSSS